MTMFNRGGKSTKKQNNTDSESRQNTRLPRDTDTLRGDSIHWSRFLLFSLRLLQGLVVGPDGGVGGVIEGVALKVCLDAVW